MADTCYYITLEELSELTKMSKGTLRVHLGRSEFDKYASRVVSKNHPKIVWALSRNFITELIDYFITTKKFKYSQNLKSFLKDFETEKKKYNCRECIYPELAETKKQLVIVNNHYNALLKRYNELLSMNIYLKSQLKKA